MNDKNNIKVCLGIDLGTTYSVMSYQTAGEVKVLENSEGSYITPSFVYIDPKKSEAEVGIVAKRRASREPENVFSLFKRLIGNRLDDVKNLKLNYKIGADDKGMAQVLSKDGKGYSPVFLASRILKSFKDQAEKRLGCKVEHAVITVPAYFNNSQREATKAAGELAGFTVERIINEPTAAALAAGSTFQENDKVLVYDLGGGTFDISLVEKSDGVMQVVGQDGDTQLGGADFDQVLINLLEDKIFQETGKRCTSARSKYEIRESAESLKKQLSNKAIAEVSVPYLGPEFGTGEDGSPYSLEMQVSRSTYQQATKHLVDKTIKLLDKVLQDAEYTVQDISKVVLVGGMTRDLQVIETLNAKFGEGRVVKQHNPDLMVSIGAAIQGAILLGIADQKFDGLQLLDATPLSLGIETLGGRMTVIIPKNSTIPMKKTQTFSTAADNQTSVGIKVGQGERTSMSDNHLMGSFELTGIEPQPRGIPQIEVTFDINTNGIVTVTAKDAKTGKQQDINIDTNLSKDEVKRMQEESEKFKQEDELKAKFIDAKVSAEQMVYVAEELLKTKETEETEEHAKLSSSLEELRTVIKDSQDSDKLNELEYAVKNLEQEMMNFRTMLSKKSSAGQGDQSDQSSDPKDSEPSQDEQGTE